MKLYFRQRIFSWFDSYDVYDEAGERVYTIKGQLAWGHCLKIYDACGMELGMVKERILTFLPKFEIYIRDRYIGCISKELTFFRPKFNIDYNGWQVQGDWFEWDYQILSDNGSPVAYVTKELLHLTDTYVINVQDPKDSLCALMLVLAIDAEKCSRED